MAPRTAVQRHTVRPACGRRAQGGREKGTKRRRAAQKNGVDDVDGSQVSFTQNIYAGVHARAAGAARGGGAR
jgi:hypothetical protein